MDKHIIDQWAKDEMAEREIKPSVSVWEQIEAELDKEEQPTPKSLKNRIIWLGGLVTLGIMATTWFYFSQTPELNQKPVTEIIVPESTPVEEQPQPASPPVQTQQNEDVIPQQEEKVIQKSIKKMPFVPTPVKNKTQEVIKEQPKQSQTEQPLFVVQTHETTLENVSPVATVAKADDIKTQDITQKKGKIDPNKLLAEVEKEVSKKSKKYNIDPDVLLKEAEKGANERFFNKMVKTLSATSNAVVTAVNNRNTAL
jgi:hypothetical protein